MSKRLLSILAVAATLTLSGCGFRLQGDYQLPAELAQVQLVSSDKQGELHRKVESRLALLNVDMVDDPAAPRLWIGGDRLERATVSLFPSGQVAEYELIYSLNSSIQLPDRQAQQFEIEIRRDYLADPRTALAKDRELERLLSEMRDQAADRLIRNLASTQIDAVPSNTSVSQ